MYVSYKWQSWWSVSEILTGPSTRSGYTTNQKCCAGCQSWKPEVQVGHPEKLVHRVNREELRIDARMYRVAGKEVSATGFICGGVGVIGGFSPSRWVTSSVRTETELLLVWCLCSSPRSSCGPMHVCSCSCQPCWERFMSWLQPYKSCNGELFLWYIAANHFREAREESNTAHYEQEHHISLKVIPSALLKLTVSIACRLAYFIGGIHQFWFLLLIEVVRKKNHWRESVTHSSSCSSAINCFVGILQDRCTLWHFSHYLVAAYLEWGKC